MVRAPPLPFTSQRPSSRRGNQAEDAQAKMAEEDGYGCVGAYCHLLFPVLDVAPLLIRAALAPWPAAMEHPSATR